MNTHVMPIETVPPGNTPKPRPLRVLVFSSTFPSHVQPIHGVFVKERIRHVALLPECEVEVVSPVPYFPPLRSFPRWYPLSQYASHETIDGLSVSRPRYFLLPKIGKYFHPLSMAVAARRRIRQLRKRFDFDVIDAHFAYPDGVAAAQLAKWTGRPLVITGRGEDVLTCPNDPSMRQGIQWALKQASRLIAVSSEIADAMEALGADPSKIHVVANGVDCEKFRPLDQGACRRHLQIPEDRPVVISVGYLLERKGYHILAEAADRLRQKYPSILVLIVGGVARWGQDYTPVIRQRIDDLGLGDHVRLIGPRPPEELPHWYNAADIFTLLTNREGCPNALLEAMACGLPAVATPVGEIPHVVNDARLGILLPARTAEAAAAGLDQALTQTWNRATIVEMARRRGWPAIAEKVLNVLREAADA